MNREVVSKLVYSIIQFLKNELEAAGTLTEERAESVEVAIQCLETAYGIQSESSHLSSSSSLYQIFQNFIKDEIVPESVSHMYSDPSEEDKAEADRLKNEGNDLMREENYNKALECYTKALSKNRNNAVYYCNRAAAHCKLNNHLEAIEDCKKALRIDSQYSKAYGRMGFAYSSLDRAKEAKECYEKALEIEPENESYRGNLIIAEEKMRSQELSSSSEQPSGTAAQNPFAAMGGDGGFLAGLEASGLGRGAPDLQNMFGNPGIMNMASQLMSDPNMQNMMSSFLTNMGGAPEPSAPPPEPTPTPTQPPPPTTDGGSSPQGMEALLTAGRQLAEQMQAQHPDLVEQLRSQMGRPGSGTGPTNGNPDSSQPPQS